MLEKIAEKVKTPCYLVDEKKITDNCKILKGVNERTGSKILLAQKAFSMYSMYPVISNYLQGTTASGLYEAKLGKEEFGKETHVYSAAYKDEDMDEILQYSDHIVFNSFNQFYRFRDKAIQLNKEIGIRINPGCSTQEGHDIYNPCGFGSRLGVTIEEFEKNSHDLRGLCGLHFHTLCEQNSDALSITMESVEKDFGKYLHKLKWINFGGGHHITREDYDIELLENIINHVKESYNVDVYLEPGEAVALNAGYLVASVLDIVSNDINIAILDTSAACHMPDVLEMPYEPRITGAMTLKQMEEAVIKKDAEEKNKSIFMLNNKYSHMYRLAGPTCLAGDIIGDYYFEKELQKDDRLIFHDMAIYSMVKNNTFNGMPLPDIDILHGDGSVENIKTFGYEDFKSRI